MTDFASIFLKDFGPLRVNNDLSGRNSSFKQNEIIAIFPDDPDKENLDDYDIKIKKINGTDLDEQKTVERGKRQKCNCNSSIQLWKDLSGIHTLTHGEPVIGGSVSKATVASDSSATEIPVEFALNFEIPIPDEYTLETDLNYGKAVKNKLEPVVIAVLDTGVDEQIPKEFLWSKKMHEAPQQAAHSENGSEYGHSFTGDEQIWSKPGKFNRNKANDTNINDTNNKNEHGTLVSLYIINEFLKKGVPVELMVLKTHNENGEGDFYTIYQALHFAITHKVHIINASWGFYSYLNNMGSFLKKELADKLRANNILLITAAGNKIDAVDNFAVESFKADHTGDISNEWVPRLSGGLLRNLEIHNFFPACLSNDTSNVIAVTTVDDNDVSQTQNYSSKHVDIGVKADKTVDGRMLFDIPFQKSGIASGSSFAAAIATGIIGANVVSRYINSKGINSNDPVNLNKEKVLEDLSSITRNNSRLEEKIKMGKVVFP